MVVGVVVLCAPLALYGFGVRRVEAVARQARSAVAERRLDQARQRLDEWIALRPRAAEPYYLRALVEVIADRPRPALDALRQALDRGYDKGACEILYAVLLARGGKHNEAEPVLRAALDRGSGPHPEVEEALARIYLASFRLNAAAEAIDRWLKDAPDDPRPYLWRNEVDQRIDAEPAVLIHNYRMALQRDPALAQARLGLADKLRETRRLEEAKGEYDIYLAADPKNAAGHVGAGQVELQRGDLSAALRHFEAALAIDEKEPVASLELALIDLRRGRYIEARDRLAPLVTADPYDSEARYNYARALKMSGDEARARTESAEAERLRKDNHELNDIRQSIVRRPDDPELRSAAARWMLEHGHDQQGLDWAQLVLRTHPGHRPTCRLLADYYEKKGDMALANSYRALLSDAAAESAH
jgi:predicted Zn-dependent protease